MLVLANPSNSDGLTVPFSQGLATGGQQYAILQFNGNVNTVNAGQFDFSLWDGTSATDANTTTSAIPSTRQWHVYAGQNAAGTAKVFIDGVDKTNSTGGSASNFAPAGARLVIGAFCKDLSRVTSCSIGIVLAWNRALSAGEMLDISQDPFQIITFPDDELMGFTFTGPQPIPSATISQTLQKVTQAVSAAPANAAAQTLQKPIQSASVTVTNPPNGPIAQTLKKVNQLAAAQVVGSPGNTAFTAVWTIH